MVMLFNSFIFKELHKVKHIYFMSNHLLGSMQEKLDIIIFQNAKIVKKTGAHDNFNFLLKWSLIQLVEPRKSQ